MEYQKIPLKEQLERAEDGCIVHPEYIPCAIRAWADIPLPVYFGGGEDGEEGTGQLAKLLGISPAFAGKLAYKEAAMRVSRLRRKPDGKGRELEAVRLLAQPLADAYQRWKEAWENAKKEET